MSREIAPNQFRTNSDDILRGLDDGETFVVTVNGVPVGELTPVPKHRFVSAESALAMFRPAPHVEPGRLIADLDRVASQEIEFPD